MSDMSSLGDRARAASQRWQRAASRWKASRPVAKEQLAGGEVVNAVTTLAGMGSELFEAGSILADSVCATAEKIEKVAAVVEELQAMQLRSDFLAQFRGPLSEFTAEMAERVLGADGNWEQLARVLEQEEEESEGKGEATNRLLKELAGLGFSWEEWTSIRAVMGAANLEYELGSWEAPNGVLMGLKQGPVPQDLIETTPSLETMLEYLDAV